jgi:ribonuclease HI
MSEIKIWIDGGCNPNPGKGTIGIYSKNFRCGLCLSGQSTNNRMEYVALYGALKLADQLGFKNVSILTDSSIVARTFNNKNYSGAKNKTLHAIRTAFIKKAADIAKLSVGWVRREENVDADELTNLAYDNDVWEGLEAIDKNAFIDDLKSKIAVVED